MSVKERLHVSGTFCLACSHWYNGQCVALRRPKSAKEKAQRQGKTLACITHRVRRYGMENTQPERDTLFLVYRGESIVERAFEGTLGQCVDFVKNDKEKFFHWLYNPTYTITLSG